MDLNEQISAVVVGGASGMGAATVRALRACGTKVAIIDRSLDGGRLLADETGACLLYTSPSPRDRTRSRMPSSA